MGSPSAGNAALLKDGGKLAWPEALQEAGFDAAGRRLSQSLQLAVATLKDKEPLPAALLRGRFLSPDWPWLGTSPKYRPTALALRNRCGSSTNAATASAVRTPTPGIVRSRATPAVCCAC